MLYPKMNGFREVIDLSGFFDFKLDPDNVGEEKNWQKVLKAPAPLVFQEAGMSNLLIQEIILAQHGISKNSMFPHHGKKS